MENGSTTCWGIIGDQINRVWNVMPLANSLGAAWLSEDGLTATGYLNSEASVKAMTFYQDLFNKYGVSPKGVNTNEAREMFETGKVAFTWGDPVCYARAKGKGINVGVCPVPYFEGGVPAVGCDSWHIASMPIQNTRKRRLNSSSILPWERGAAYSWTARIISGLIWNGLPGLRMLLPRTMKCTPCWPAIWRIILYQGQRLPDTTSGRMW